ncbi:fluoride efflux transporter CrcB [Billgrantia endophytica]|uniref:Fluoride-specific ion channel FluC n=1 Tax=Billgrantia endophytica TaxID=2033802 RepID=A0A2N7U0U2_9GAMM|nr:fluoride efflux transporter CrcB [Halomonas endophytica]PMR74049.1 fluoride efflux transporter CrcB [Halomonas endophytica]
MGYLIVFIGAGFGGMARHAANMAALRIFGSNGFPFGTLAINVFGSMLLGIVIEYVALRYGASPQVRLFLATGVLGGFTTFSAFSLETVQLVERGQAGVALVYVVSSVILSVGALFLAMLLFRAAFGIDAR